MSKILVTGSNGQLGSEIRKTSSSFEHEFHFTDVDELDIADLKKLKEYFTQYNFDVIINCASYTAVDKAEEEAELAETINISACKNIAKLCKEHNVRLIHISTDYVFDGKNYKPYIENDNTYPQSVYGKTKLEGENEILNILSDAIIVRTSWLYSEFGNNFVKTIIKFAKERKKLDVVFDQIGTPTYAVDLAKALLNIVPKIKQIKKNEIFHYSNEGAISWYDFAKAIIEINDIDCEVIAVDSTEFQRAAPRPFYSVLDKTKFKKEFNISIPYWKDSLKKCLRILDK